MAVPTRSVLVVGHRDSNAFELLGTLTAKKKSLTLPCLHRVKIESADGILHADLQLWMRMDPNSPSQGEPDTHDAVVVVYDAFKKNTCDILQNEWKEKIASFESPKVLVATGLEEGVEHFISEESSDSNAEDPKIFSASSAEALSADLGVVACFELSNRLTHRVREVFSHVLRSAIDPMNSKKDISEDDIRDTRNLLLSQLRDKNIGVPLEKPKRVKSAEEAQQAKTVLQALGAEQTWKPHKSRNGRTYWKNTKTGEKVRKKKEFPPDFDGETTQEEREKVVKKKLEHEIDKTRSKHIKETDKERIERIAQIEGKNRDEFESVMMELIETRDELKQEVEKKQEEYKSIRQMEEDNGVRSHKIQDYAYLRVRKEGIIQKRVKEDIEHERKMAELQEELDTLENTDRVKPITTEKFDAVANENRRYQQTLKAILEEARMMKNEIKKVEKASREMLAKTDTEELGCMKGESKIQKMRNDHTKLRETTSALRREKDFLTNELMMQKGTEAAHATQLREWKREKKALTNMISEIDERITQQEVPIAEYLEEEKKRARLRGGPLILDEEDEAHWKARKPKAGDYRAPSDKQLMLRLKNEHDRLLLEYQFLCSDLMEKATSSDEAFAVLQNSVDSYVASEQTKTDVYQAVSENLHKLLLLLQDLLTTRTRALRRLESKENKVGDQLLAIENAMQGFVTQERSGVVSADLKDKIARTRRLLYKKTSEMEKITLLRKEQCKALKAISKQKEKVVRRVRESANTAEEEEEGAELLISDCRELITAVEVPNTVRRLDTQCRTFLSKALTGLHTETQGLLVKKCSGRKPLMPFKGGTSVISQRPNLPQESKDKASVLKSTSLSRKPFSSPATNTTTTAKGIRPSRTSKAGPALSSAKVQYDQLVDSLKKEFGMPHEGGKHTGTWKKTW